MTAIAAIFKDGVPVIVSDMLVSVPARATSVDHLYIPTGLTAVQDLDSHHPAGFVQKCIIISPFLVLAWAGRVIFGSWACRYLREHYGSREIFDEALTIRIVDELSAECTDQDAFMVSTLNRSAEQFILKHNGAWWGQVEGVCDMFLAGSGAAHIYEAAEALGNVPGTGSLGWATVLVATMIEREVASRTSTIASYGAAWDIVHLTKDGFKKLDPVVFSQWIIEDDDDTYSYACECLIGTKYFESRLSIKAIINTIMSDPVLMYADAWPPDGFGRTIPNLGAAEFKFDSPNQVVALKYKMKSNKTNIIYHVHLDANDDERIFREVSTNLRIMQQALRLEYFDKAFSEFKKL